MDGVEPGKILHATRRVNHRPYCFTIFMCFTKKMNPLKDCKTFYFFSPHKYLTFTHRVTWKIPLNVNPRLINEERISEHMDKPINSITPVVPLSYIIITGLINRSNKVVGACQKKEEKKYRNMSCTPPTSKAPPPPTTTIF